VIPLPYGLEELSLEKRRVATNGVELNVFTAGSGPLVVLLHGFPECWANWGPQIGYLVDKGYTVAVPEMRGYGESDAPDDVEAYDTLELAADVVGLIDAFGQDKAVVIGHDWGCIVAWHVAWIHPERLVGVAGLSVPWFGRGKRSTLDSLSYAMQGQYFYIKDFQRPVLDEQLNADHRETLTRVLCGTTRLLSQADDGTPFLERFGLSDPAPDYLPAEFMDYLISRYRFSGFRGPLNWYRNFDRTFERTEGRDDTIQLPAMFLTGTDEWAYHFVRKTGFDMSALFSDLRINKATTAGHWLGQEKPDWVNDNIGEFLDGLSSS
jgi:pimeloyl-ACP methyl ester carboxylesterase